MAAINLLVFIYVFSLSQGEIPRDQIGQYRSDFITLEDGLWENYSVSGVLEVQLKVLLENVSSFVLKMDQTPHGLTYGVEPLHGCSKFTDLQKELMVIETTYKKFNRYRIQCDLKKDCDFDGLVDDVRNSENGINATMFQVQHILYGGSENMITELYKFTGINGYWCKDIPQSVQLLYYNFYNLLSGYQLKSYFMWQVVNMWKFLVDDEQKMKSVEESIYARHIYKEWVRTIYDKLTVASKDRYIKRCHPHTFVKGENYEEFTRLLQGHIENEVDMSSGSTCTESCKSYSRTQSYRCYDYQSEYCQKIPRCRGTITGCFFVEEDASICVSQNPARRYEYVTYKSGKTLGASGHCPEKRTVNSWLRWFVRCHYCMCLCDEEGPKSDRYISLKPAYSNLNKNMVVTGIRFRKNNRLLHLQIQEGKLLPYGRIDQSSVHWVDVSEYKITDPDVTEGIDFFTMTSTRRSMDMDEIRLDDNHILTGIRFIKSKERIKLEGRAHEFDWVTGKIKPWSCNSIIDRSFGTKILMQKTDVPTKTKWQSVMYHDVQKKYVEFTHTDFDKDAAQTTIPFIDLQEVVTEPPALLSGAGVYYKGNTGYGGFIAPKIRTFNYGVLLTTNIPQKPTINFVFDYPENV